MTSSKALVTACDRGFLVGAKALIRGVNSFHPDVACYCIVPAGDREFIGQELRGMADVVTLPRSIRGVPDGLQIAVAKLFTPMVDADVAVWLDCDCILCRPAPELWNVPEGKINVVQDTAYRILDMVEPDLRTHYERQFPGLGEKRGFNGGFFSLHVSSWKDLPERYERAFAEGGYPHYPKIFDQPLLNGMFREVVNFLPFAFNAHHGFDYPIPRDVRVVHFTNMPKPWMPSYPKHQPQYYYWMRYGEGESRLLPLLMARLRILFRTPRRLLMMYIRSVGLLGDRNKRGA